MDWRKGGRCTEDPANQTCSSAAGHLMLEVRCSLIQFSHHQNKQHRSGEKRCLQTTLRSSVTGGLFPPPPASYGQKQLSRDKKRDVQKGC